VKPGIEILRVVAAESPADSALRRICRDVSHLESMLAELPDSPDRSQMSTLIEFCAYQSMSLIEGEELAALERMILEFRCRLERDPHQVGQPAWMSESMRELSHMNQPDDRLGGSAFVLPRAHRAGGALPIMRSDS
jgi:hypothetical protein